MINNILFQYQSFSDRLEVKSLCITRVFIIYYLLFIELYRKKFTQAFSSDGKKTDFL